MSIHSQHSRWDIEGTIGISIGGGPGGVNLSEYYLTGDRSNRLVMRFIGAGPGASIGLNLRGEEIAESVSADPGLVPSVSATSPVVFAGATRSGANFDGFGYILEANASAGFGSGIQLFIFNLAASPAVLVQIGELILQYRSGAIQNLNQLRRVAPAFALGANALKVGGIGAGVMAYHGRWIVSERSAQRLSNNNSVVSGPQTYLY